VLVFETGSKSRNLRSEYETNSDPKNYNACGVSFKATTWRTRSSLPLSRTLFARLWQKMLLSKLLPKIATFERKMLIIILIFPARLK
jgi:hypothetical protein